MAKRGYRNGSMRFLMLLGFGVLACGGSAANGQVSETAAGSGGASSAAGATAGLTSKLTSGGGATGRAGAAPAAGAGGAVAAASGGTTAGAPSSAGTSAGGSLSGSGGVASAGTGGASAAGSGGTSGAAAGDAGPGGEGGAPPAPDDTGCMERPWSGNLADLSEKLPVFDCSGCSNARELGYELTDGFCEGINTCTAVIDASILPADSYIILPKTSLQTGSVCGREQACGSAAAPQDFPGFDLQLTLNITGAKVEVDDARRVLPRNVPLLACGDVASCYAVGSPAQLAVVAPTNAPRGWLRVRHGGTVAACE